MKINKYISIFVVLLIVSAGSVNSIELLPSPIQNELKNSIYLAADNWDLEETDDSKNNTVENNSNSPKINKNNKTKKSALKAALYSALIPGLGEHYVGHRTKAKVFFAIEAVTWINLIVFHSYGEWKKDDMVRIASEKAGASLEGKDDEFLDWVGFYNSSEEFNSLGRVSDPERAFLTGTDNYWQWSSGDDRENYRDYKNSSRTAFNRANFMIVAAISTRIVSVIDAIRDAKRSGKSKAIDISDKKSYNYKFSVDPLHADKQISITLFTPF